MMSRPYTFTFTFIFTLITFSWGQADDSITHGELSNGSPLYFSGNASQPRQSVILVFRGGLSQVQKKLHGAAAIFLDMLEEGPKGLSTEEFKKKLYLKNSSLAFGATPRAFTITMSAPPENLEEVLKLAKQTWMSSKLDQSTFDHVKTMAVQQALADFENMRSVLTHFAFKDAFQMHPEFMDGKQSPQNTEKVSFDDVKTVSALMFPLNHLEVYTSGPMTLEKTKSLIQNQILGSDAKTFSKIAFEKVQPEAFKQSSLSITLLNKPGATDNQILFIYPEMFGENFNTRITGMVTSFLLGGSGAADLFRILRTERGLTYGVNSRVDNNRNYWMVTTFGGIKQTPGLLSGVPEVVNQFRSRPVKMQNLKEAKKVLKASFRDSLELPEDRLDYLMSLSLNDVDFSLIDRYEKLLDAVKIQDVQTFAKTRLSPDKGFLYVMGDEKVLEPMLQALPSAKKGTPIRKVQMSEVP